MKQVLEKAINRYLLLDPESAKRIMQLDGKVVTLVLSGVPLTVQLLFIHGTIQLKWNDFLTADLTIRGTPLNLLHAGFLRNQRHAFFQDDIVLLGNIDLAQPVLAIFDDLDVDWEDIVSKWTGDVPAYQAGRLLRDVGKMAKRIGKTFSYNVNEYLHEEINLFPSKEAIDIFFHDVDDLRMDVDRLMARIKRLEEVL
ncbi:MAG TPA: SCP2 sterol-binding domain-containing protein [Gammaproteobacteria bacterium]|nr:SCP2 sterol-binding domain-containing protein [Gammaproteobacteria bacterium]